MIKVAIIGTGGMAHYHANTFKSIKDVSIVSVCDVNKDRVNKFADLFNIKERYTSIDELLDNSDIDAVSNVTPDSFHKEIALKCFKKDKHVFSEKPLAENYPDAQEMYEAAKKAKVINMVNFSYRNSSGLQSIAGLVQSGELGNVRHVEASYYQSWLTAKYWGDYKEDDKWLWRLSSKHGSKGTLGDIGVHIFDFVTFPVGSIKKLNTKLKTFKDKGNKIGEYKLDTNDSFVTMLEFENGALGTVASTRFATGEINKLNLKIYCEKGAVRIAFDDPIKEGNYYEITTDTETVFSDEDKKINKKLKWEKISTNSTPNNIERFIESIKSGINDQPDFERGAKIQKILDSCFESSEKEAWVYLNKI